MQPGPWRLLRALIYMLVGLMSHASSSSDIWPLERPDGMPAIQSLEVMCGKDHMDVHLSFSQPFEGIVSSKGQHSDPRCVYVPPSTGQTFFSFRIAYARCGTKPDMHGQFYENTVVVQYDKDLLEVWDEAKRLRCEWFNDYEKTASKPPMVIADLDVIQLDFRGDNVDCWMEIQHGKGPWAPPVSGIVPLGSTLTLVVAINDYRGNERHSKMQGEFDMRVKSCVASDGGGHTIQLSDEFGCVLRPKMISRFLKARGSDDRATVITYAFFHAFKFPDALSVHIKCKVEICRHGCLDHCQSTGIGGNVGTNGLIGDNLGPYLQDRNDIRQPYPELPSASGSSSTPPSSSQSRPEDASSSPLYDDIVNNADDDDDVATAIGGHFLEALEKSSASKQQQQTTSTSTTTEPTIINVGEDPVLSQPFLSVQPARVTRYQPQEHFPHGPRKLEPDDGDDGTIIDTIGGRSSREGKSRDTSELTIETNATIVNNNSTKPQLVPLSPKTTRRKRSLVVSDRKVRSADVGVSGIYEVISEADLAFSPDSHPEAVTVFQGRIREEVVYGICLPISGFSALFVIVTLSAIVSALVAGAMVHRLQAQRELVRKNCLAALAVNHHHRINATNTEITRNGQHRHQQQQQQQQYGWLRAYGLFKASRCTVERHVDNRTVIESE